MRNPDVRRGLMKENKSAEILAQAGYDIEQLPESGIPDLPDPDYRIEARIFDCYAPTTQNLKSIWDKLLDKVTRQGVPGVALNLDGISLSLSALRKYLEENPIHGLEEIIVIRDREIIHFWP